MCCIQCPILGTLHFNVMVDSGYLVGLIIEALRWIFRHGGGVFFWFKVVSTQGCVGYQVMKQNKYCEIDWVMCILEYSVYSRRTAWYVDNECNNEFYCGDCWLYSCSNCITLGCICKFRFVGLLGWWKIYFEGLLSQGGYSLPIPVCINAELHQYQRIRPKRFQQLPPKWNRPHFGVKLYMVQDEDQSQPLTPNVIKLVQR